MANFQPVTQERHAQKRWRRYASYLFAAQEPLVPLVSAELSAATMKLPIGFTQQDERFTPVAVLGLLPKQNLWVAPDGRWLGGYVPAFFRSHPFRLATTTDGQAVLCVDEDSGLVTEGTEGEPFFDAEGAPATATREVLSFLTKTAQSQQATRAVCDLLQQHNLFKPWAIKVTNEQGEQDVGGLFQIDETALNALPAEAFMALRQIGALPLVYCQLLSMQHLGELGKLAEAQARAIQARAAAAKSDSLKVDFMSQSDTIDFSRIG